MSTAAAKKRHEVASYVHDAVDRVSSTWFLYLAARRGFESDAELARALGVHRSQVARWKRGARADPANEERLRSLGATVDSLTGYLDPGVIPHWLTGVNPHLDHQRPIDALLEGRLAEVIGAVEAEKRGAYA